MEGFSTIKIVYLATFVVYCQAAKLDFPIPDYADVVIPDNGMEYLDLNDTVGPYPNSGDRNAMTGNNFKWTNGRVPYVFGTGFTSKEISTIQRAMSRISSASNNCIQFVPRTSADTYFVTFVKETTTVSCASHVGRIVPSVGNKIWFHSACFNAYGTILHEILHTLGFFHEHQRSDRCWYVYINEGNIQTGRESNFAVENTNNLGVRYDYDSVMHYPATAFSDPRGSTTIFPIWRPFNLIEKVLDREQI